MSEQVPQLDSLHCPAGAQRQSEDPCPALERILIDLHRLRAERLVIRADRLERDADRLPLFREAGEQYMALFDRSCRLDRAGLRPNGSAPNPALRCDEIIYNAWRAWLAGKDTDRAGAARDTLLDPRNKLNHSPLARKAAERR